jgi:hypothetical protein
MRTALRNVTFAVGFRLTAILVVATAAMQTPFSGSPIAGGADPMVVPQMAEFNDGDMPAEQARLVAAAFTEAADEMDRLGTASQ